MNLDMSLFLPLLALLFITLKLTGVIAWSWLWVLAPVWGWFALVGLFLLVVAVIIAFGGKINVVSRR